MTTKILAVLVGITREHIILNIGCQDVELPIDLEKVDRPTDLGPLLGKPVVVLIDKQVTSVKLYAEKK